MDIIRIETKETVITTQSLLHRLLFCSFYVFDVAKIALHYFFYNFGHLIWMPYFFHKQTFGYD